MMLHMMPGATDHNICVRAQGTQIWYTSKKKEK
jgi:hypothetical protein